MLHLPSTVRTLIFRNCTIGHIKIRNTESPHLKSAISASTQCKNCESAYIFRHYRKNVPSWVSSCSIPPIFFAPFGSEDLHSYSISLRVSWQLFLNYLFKIILLLNLASGLGEHLWMIAVACCESLSFSPYSAYLSPHFPHAVQSAVLLLTTGHNPGLLSSSQV